jgi:large subunit ribosomal protein L24
MAVAYRTNVKPRTVRLTNSVLKTKVKFGNKVVVSRALVKPSATNLVPHMHVKRGDLVMVISGSDKGTIGKVVKAFPKEGKVVVEGVNVATRHVKAKNAYVKGGIIKEEAPIFASKVMLYSNEEKKPVRAEFRKKLGLQ